MTVDVGKLQGDGELRISVTGEFGFETARELLFVCKARWQEGAKAITIDLNGVTGLSSSGVGTLILLGELVGDGRFRVHMEHCAAEVRQLFSSGLLDRYFKKGVVNCGDGGA